MILMFDYIMIITGGASLLIVSLEIMGARLT